jgi:hypothetical protein
MSETAGTGGSGGSGGGGGVPPIEVPVEVSPRRADFPPRRTPDIIRAALLAAHISAESSAARFRSIFRFSDQAAAADALRGVKDGR